MKTYSKSELFSLANQIHKEFKVSQKEAFAMAKSQLENKQSVSLHDELVSKMKTKNVKFTFVNKHNREITTTGTLLDSHIPTGKRTIQGRKTPRTENTQVFYDVRHGVYRSYQKDKLVKVF